MASGALVGTANGRSQNKNLVEFRAGKMYMKGKMVHPDKRKGQVYIYQSEDSLMHFCWKDRTNGNVEDDLIIFPDDVEFKHVTQCTTGRVFVLKFKSSTRKFFFWMQEPKTDKDDDHCKKVNDFLNNPPTPGSSRGGHSLPSDLANLGEDPPECISCNTPFTVKHFMIYCFDLQPARDKYYHVHDMKKLFETINLNNILDFLKEKRNTVNKNGSGIGMGGGVYHSTWLNFLTESSPGIHRSIKKLTKLHLWMSIQHGKGLPMTHVCLNGTSLTVKSEYIGHSLTHVCLNGTSLTVKSGYKFIVRLELNSLNHLPLTSVSIERHVSLIRKDEKYDNTENKWINNCTLTAF
ncbi:hypothetical protein ACJMK2_001560 [Sinanodonta woodiana]|uniref:Pru domain-containing protein n=1 Tax=Sinanodonta woodiana TaxID=1069815 RepID=A0ABD3XVZ4_SINWO